MIVGPRAERDCLSSVESCQFVTECFQILYHRQQGSRRNHWGPGLSSPDVWVTPAVSCRNVTYRYPFSTATVLTMKIMHRCHFAPGLTSWLVKWRTSTALPNTSLFPRRKCPTTTWFCAQDRATRWAVCRVSQHGVPGVLQRVLLLGLGRAASARVQPFVQPCVQQAGRRRCQSRRREGLDRVSHSGLLLRVGQQAKLDSVFDTITIKPAKEQAQVTCGPSRRRLNSSWSKTIWPSFGNGENSLSN